MSKNRSVIGIAMVTGEEIEPEGLPVLKVYTSKERKDEYLLLEGIEVIEEALKASIKHLGKPSSTVVFLAVEVITRTEGRRRRRSRKKGGES